MISLLGIVIMIEIIVLFIKNLKPKNKRAIQYFTHNTCLLSSAKQPNACRHCIASFGFVWLADQFKWLNNPFLCYGMHETYFVDWAKLTAVLFFANVKF